MRHRLQLQDEILPIANIEHDLAEALLITQNITGIPTFKMLVFRDVVLKAYEEQTTPQIDESSGKQERTSRRAEKPLMNEIVNHIMQHCTKVYVDSSNPEVIRELKNRIGEYHDYHGWLTEDQIWSRRSSNSWQIIPVNLQKRHREMLQWTYTLLSNRFIKIHPSLQQLIVSLRTAIVSDGWKLDKQQTSRHFGRL